jgi:ankyrin repeat protein
VEAKPAEPVAEAATPEPSTVKVPDITIHDAVWDGNIEAVKQHLAAGADVNAKGDGELTPLHWAAIGGHKEVAELLIAAGADVNPFWVIPMLGTHKPEMATPRKPSD